MENCDKRRTRRSGRRGKQPTTRDAGMSARNARSALRGGRTERGGGRANLVAGRPKTWCHRCNPHDRHMATSRIICVAPGPPRRGVAGDNDLGARFWDDRRETATRHERITSTPPLCRLHPSRSTPPRGNVPLPPGRRPHATASHPVLDRMDRGGGVLLGGDRLRFARKAAVGPSREDTPSGR